MSEIVLTDERRQALAYALIEAGLDPALVLASEWHVDESNVFTGLSVLRDPENGSMVLNAQRDSVARVEFSVQLLDGWQQRFGYPLTANHVHEHRHPID